MFFTHYSSSHLKPGTFPTRGFNLVEAAIVLGVVGLVIGGIWIAASAASETYKVNKSVEGMFQTSRNIQNTIPKSNASVIGNNGDMVPIVINANLAPADWVKNGTLVNPFGGSIDIYNVSGDWRYTISFNNVPKSACIKMLRRMSEIGNQANNFMPSTSWGNDFNLRLGLGWLGVNYPSWDTRSFPVDLDTAITACNLDQNVLAAGWGYARMR